MGSFIEESIDASYMQTFSYILHPIESQNLAFMFLLDIFACFSCDSRKSMWGNFLSFKHVRNNPSMAMIQMGNDSVSRSRTLFYLEKLCEKILLDVFKLFPKDIRDVITSYFCLIEHQCHHSVEKVFLEDSSFNFSTIAYVFKCDNVLFPTSKRRIAHSFIYDLRELVIKYLKLSRVLNDTLLYIMHGFSLFCLFTSIIFVLELLVLNCM